ncbi:LysM domain-containing protein [Clostridium sp. USBA 49]|jgi:spore germination cell wall hydrolase CwlJ-like protein|nr:LysM domain-containing protein [Clostridium sp. USBA 49]
MIKLNKFKTTLLAVSLAVLSTNSAKAANYKVVQGDSLYTISKTFNTNTNTLKNTNNLKSDIIYPGQVLDVPAKTYTVKSGDSLYLISKKYQISLDLLRKANNYWKDTIYVGQTLLIPEGSVSAVSTPSNISKSVISYTESDLDLLARLITAEAQGEPYKAQVAVGAVVINRVQSANWPNTIKEVIYQKSNGYYQFTPVLNGWINKPASSTARQAALEALKGSDPTNGAEFYFDNSTTNAWLWSKPISLKVGNMIFALK